MASQEPSRHDHTVGGSAPPGLSEPPPCCTARSVIKNIAECSSEPTSTAAEPPRADHGVPPVVAECCCVPNTLSASPIHTTATPPTRPRLRRRPSTTRARSAVHADCAAGVQQASRQQHSADEINDHCQPDVALGLAAAMKHLERLAPLSSAREDATGRHPEHVAQRGHKEHLFAYGVVQPQVVDCSRLQRAGDHIARQEESQPCPRSRARVHGTILAIRILC
eukprot:scaffold3713_cov112-Isochrysis_galbana.AAC.1